MNSYKKKLDIVNNLIHQNTPTIIVHSCRKSPTKRIISKYFPKLKRRPSKLQLNSMISSSLKNNKSLKEKLEEANVKIKRQENENKTLQIKVKLLQKSKNKLLKEVESNKKIFSLSTKLSYHNIITDNKPSSFKYLCGLSIEKINVLFDVTSPYVHAIKYQDCKGTGNQALDKKN